MGWSSARHPRRRRIWIGVIVGLIALIVVGRVVATPIVKHVVSDSLVYMKDGYTGEVRDVELSILTGEVALLDMRIFKKNGRVPVPFMDIKRFVLAAVWESYAPRLELVATDAKISLVDAKSKAAQQWGPTFDLEDLRRQLPLELSAVRFVDGEFHFYNFEAKPRIDLAVRDLDVQWEKLTGCLPPGWAACDSTLAGEGAVMRGGRLGLKGRFDRHKGPKFFAHANVNNLKPVQFNAMLTEYAKIDAQDGTIDVEVLYHNKPPAQRLVLVPRLYDVKIVGSERDGEVKTWRELLAGIGAGFFERRRGTKAIEYKAGKWGMIDWGGERSARAESR
jgi:hypothetical protein